MAKATNVAVQTKKIIAQLADQVDACERRLITITAMLDAMLTKPQRERLEALLADPEVETEALQDEPEETQ
jgi:hypothetical protein